MIRYFGVFFAVMLLSQCSTAKQKGGVIGDFFKAVGSGDTSVLKKWKKIKEEDDTEWEEVK